MKNDLLLEISTPEYSGSLPEISTSLCACKDNYRSFSLWVLNKAYFMLEKMNVFFQNGSQIQKSPHSIFPLFYFLDLIGPSKPKSKENCFDLTIFCGAGGSFLVVAGRLVHANVQQNEGIWRFLRIITGSCVSIFVVWVL